MLLLLAGAASAYAAPTLEVAETQARTGDTVHFSIADADHGTTYVFRIGDEEVAHDKARGRHGLAGEFKMPHLGEVSRVVTLEARPHRDDDDEDGKHDEDGEDALDHSLLYLAPSQPAVQPADVPPAVVLVQPPAPVPPATSLPSAIDSPASEKGTPSPERPHGKGRRHRGRGGAELRKRSRTRHRARRHGKRAARRREGARLRPLPGSGGAAGPLSWVPPADDSADDPARAVAPRATITPASRIVDTGESGVSFAVIVPGLLALAAFGLATVVVVRRWRGARARSG